MSRPAPMISLDSTEVSTSPHPASAACKVVWCVIAVAHAMLYPSSRYQFLLFIYRCLPKIFTTVPLIRQIFVRFRYNQLSTNKMSWELFARGHRRQVDLSLSLLPALLGVDDAVHHEEHYKRVYQYTWSELIYRSLKTADRNLWDRWYKCASRD